jgi:tetratricopeptide (TPR) repeat protein
MAEISAEQSLQLAMRHFQAGRLGDAHQVLDQILRENPNNDSAVHLLGMVGRAAGHRDTAVLLIRKAIEINGNNSNYHNNLGITLCELGRSDEAIEVFRRAIELRPEMAEAHNNLAIALRTVQKLEESETACRRAISLTPDYADAWNTLANILQDKNDFPGAVAAYRRAIEINLNNAALLNNLSSALRTNGELDEAIDAAHRSLAINPSFAEAHNSLGSAKEAKALFDEAIAAYRQAIACRPDYSIAHSNLGMALLRIGNSDEGWAEHEWRLKWEGYYPRSGSLGRRWESQALRGETILLEYEQGLGDSIQYIRYAPQIAKCGGRSVIRCHPELADLFRSNPDLGEIVSMDEPLPRFDMYCPLLSLPLLFKHEPIPSVVPYLRADPAHLKKWEQKLAPEDRKLRVGLVWAGNPNFYGDRTRSISWDRLAPITGVHGVKFYSLQKGKVAQQIQSVAGGIDLIDLGDQLTSLLDTAAVVSQLDLVITTDTMMAHLAGALSRPTWILLQFVPHFCWLWNRDDSPWYPTARLFRQRSPGDWDEVIARVANELAALARERFGNSSSR